MLNNTALTTANTTKYLCTKTIKQHYKSCYGCWYVQFQFCVIFYTFLFLCKIVETKIEKKELNEKIYLLNCIHICVIFLVFYNIFFGMRLTYLQNLVSIAIYFCGYYYYYKPSNTNNNYNFLTSTSRNHSFYMDYNYDYDYVGILTTTGYLLE